MTPGWRPVLPGAVGAATLALLLPAVSSAAFTPATPTTGLPPGLAGLGVSPGAVVAGGPGQAAVVGQDAETGATRAVAHGAGTGWTSGAALGDGSQVTGGDGTVVERSDDTAAVSRFAPGGAVVPLGTFGLAGDENVTDAVSAADGSALVVATGGTGSFRAYHRTPGGTWSVFSPAGTATVSVVAVDTAAAGLQAVWAEEEAGEASRVRGVVFAPGATPETPPGALTLASLGQRDPRVSVPSIEIAGGSVLPTAVWTESSAETTPSEEVRAGVGGTGGSRSLDGPVTDGSFGELDARASADGGLVATWTGSDDGVRTLGGLSSAGAACRAATALVASDLVRRGGDVVLVGVDAAGAVSDRTATSGCATADPVSGPVLAPGAGPVVAGVDGEGSVVAAVGVDEGTVLTTDDRTAPTLEPLDVPARVSAAGGARVAGTPADAWGVGAVRWSVDGAGPFADGATVALPPLAPGGHELTATATDLAGNVRGASRRVEVDPAPAGDDEGTAPPPAAALPAAPSPPPPAVAPPTEVPLPPTPPVPAARPSRPLARVLSFRRTTGGWVLRVRVRDTARLRLSLFRNPYLPGDRLQGRPTTCVPRSGPVRRPPAGLRGRRTVAVSGDVVAVRITGVQARALARRGRYALRVVAYGPGVRPAHSPPVTRRVTVC